MTTTLTPRMDARRTPPIAVPTVEQPQGTPRTPAPAIGETLIDARHVNVFYRHAQAIRNVSLSVRENEVVALIGPSGCGKSTFLRCVNRLNDLIVGCRVDGQIIIGGQDIYSRETDLVSLRRQVGLVFQKPNPFPRSIYENLTFGPKLRGGLSKSDLDALVEDVLRKAALWDETKDRLHESALGLSGGQQQRLCIARALATRPRILLMDEPCSALDPIATAKIEDLIDQLKSEYTILIVTHNMQQAARVSDRTAFFFVGELIEYDATSVIFTNPSHKQTEQYVTGRFG